MILGQIHFNHVPYLYVFAARCWFVFDVSIHLRVACGIWMALTFSAWSVSRTVRCHGSQHLRYLLAILEICSHISPCSLNMFFVFWIIFHDCQQLWSKCACVCGFLQNMGGLLRSKMCSAVLGRALFQLGEERPRQGRYGEIEDNERGRDEDKEDEDEED